MGFQEKSYKPSDNLVAMASDAQIAREYERRVKSAPAYRDRSALACEEAHSAMQAICRGDTDEALSILECLISPSTAAGGRL